MRKMAGLAVMIGAALAAGCDFVWLLNNDAYAHPAALRRQSERESAAIIAFTSAIGAYGGFFIPKAYGSSIALTGSPVGALWVLSLHRCIRVLAPHAPSLK